MGHSMFLSHLVKVVIEENQERVKMIPIARSNHKAEEKCYHNPHRPIVGSQVFGNQRQQVNK